MTTDRAADATPARLPSLSRAVGLRDYERIHHRSAALVELVVHARRWSPGRLRLGCEHRRLSAPRAEHELHRDLNRAARSPVPLQSSPSLLAHRAAHPLRQPGVLGPDRTRATVEGLKVGVE